MTRALSSPNSMVWLFAAEARALAADAETAGEARGARSKAVAATVMAIACVETFLNTQARLLLFRDPTFAHRQQIERDLKAKKALGRKLEEWPLLMFGKKADFGSGPAQRFKVMLDRRNDLMHFISDTHAFQGDGFIINGLMDTTALDSLTPADGWNSVQAAEDFIEYLLALQGVAADQLPHALHHWIGKVPPRVA